MCVTAESLSGEVALGTVGGGSETKGWDKSKVSDADLAEALRLTLADLDFLSPDPATARYRLDAFLVELNQPDIGFDMEVVSFIRYELTDNRTGTCVYDDVKTASCTLGIGDAFAAIKRLRLASEGSVRANIEMFVDDLCSDTDVLMGEVR